MDLRKCLASVKQSSPTPSPPLSQASLSLSPLLLKFLISILQFSIHNILIIILDLLLLFAWPRQLFIKSSIPTFYFLFSFLYFLVVLNFITDSLKITIRIWDLGLEILVGVLGLFNKKETMSGALSMLGSVVDFHMCPCLCGNFMPTTDALVLSNGSYRSVGYLGFYRNAVGRKQFRRGTSLELSSSFVDAWQEWRLTSKVLYGLVRSNSRKQMKHQNLVIVGEFAGQYEDNFDDVKKQILNYFTYKAVRTVLNQLYEMNPTQYRWLYDFVVTNKPGDGRRFIRSLGKEKQDLAERVMVTRLHLYSRWVKKYNHAEMYKEISDENLELMRERLMETVVWPSEDTNA